MIEVFDDVHPNLRHCDPGEPPHHGLSVRSDQELLKVPFDVVDLQGLPEEPVGGVLKAVPYWRAGVLEDWVIGLEQF